MGGYLAGLVLMPIIAVAYIGESFSGSLQLGIIAGELIFVPLVAFRILLRLKVGALFQRAKGTLIDWTFFLVSYVIIGLNREVLLKDTLSLLPVFFIAFATTIVLGRVIEMCGKLLGPKRETMMPLVVLLGTLKNYGLAVGRPGPYPIRQAECSAGHCSLRFRDRPYNLPGTDNDKNNRKPVAHVSWGIGWNPVDNG